MFSKQFLKVVREMHTLTEFGIGILGALTEKALSPVLHLVLFSLSNSCDDDRRVLLGLYGVRRQDRY